MNIDQFYKALGWRLMALRQKHGINITQAAAKAGVTPRSWRAWETASRRPTHWSLHLVCQAFDCRYSWLITGKRDPGMDWLFTGSAS